VIRNALGAFLQAAADDGGLVVNLADDEDWADDAGGEALQNHGLVVVDGDLGPDAQVKYVESLVSLVEFWPSAGGILVTAAFLGVWPVAGAHHSMCIGIKFEKYPTMRFAGG
jgi:hypothetical protein